MLDYKTLIDAESMYNTPPCYTIYMMGIVLKWICLLYTSRCV